MRIAMLNMKGGVAKTTTTMFLASTAVRRGGKAVVWDADPQSSASLWADAARRAGSPLGFDVRAANLSTFAAPRGDDGGEGWEFVDAPPQGRMLEAAIDAADLVVVPTSDSPLDLQQAWMTMRTVGGRAQAAVLVVKAEPSTNAFRETLEALDANLTPRFDTVIPKSQAVKKALGTDPSRQLGAYRDLFDEITRLRRQMEGEGR